MRKVVAFILTAAMTMCVLTACSKIRYATDYPITVGEQKTGINGNWSVKKIVKDNILYLAVNRNGSDKDPLNYIGIWVYDSSKDARKVYNKQYSFSKDFGDKDAWQEGGNWFIGGSPAIYFGYKTSTMYCIEKNVIISAVIDQSDEYVNVPYVPVEPVDKSIDRSILKPYIIENSAKIRKTAMRDVLGY